MYNVSYVYSIYLNIIHMNESKYQSLIIAQQKIHRYKNNIYYSLRTWEKINMRIIIIPIKKKTI